MAYTLNWCPSKVPALEWGYSWSQTSFFLRAWAWLAASVVTPDDKHQMTSREWRYTNKPMRSIHNQASLMAVWLKIFFIFLATQPRGLGLKREQHKERQPAQAERKLIQVERDGVPRLQTLSRQVIIAATYQWGNWPFSWAENLYWALVLDWATEIDMTVVRKHNHHLSNNDHQDYHSNLHQICLKR